MASLWFSAFAKGISRALLSRPRLLTVVFSVPGLMRER